MATLCKGRPPPARIERNFSISFDFFPPHFIPNDGFLDLLFDQQLIVETFGLIYAPIGLGFRWGCKPRLKKFLEKYFENSGINLARLGSQLLLMDSLDRAIGVGGGG